jgi:hypothetical protein
MSTVDKKKKTKVPSYGRPVTFSSKPVVIEVKALEKPEPIKKYPKAKYD